MSTKSRLLWLILLVVLRTYTIPVQCLKKFTLVKHYNMVQSSGKIEELRVKTVSECLKECLGNCRCSSFDMQEMSTNDANCYLRSHRDETDPARLRPEQGYSHFDIKTKQDEYCDAAKPCTSLINCCLTSNPCLNGATCSPTNDIQKRFKCACPVQFTGRYCGTCAAGFTGKNCSIKITSCRGYANETRTPQSHVIRDDENQAFKVFCDFEKDSNISWTLIQSYSLGHAETFRKPFQEDFGRNQKDPMLTWFSYRLSKARMESIQKKSTKWRITCDFDKDLKAITTDFIRGFKADLDIMTFRGHAECKKVDYINIRGYNCSDCTAVLYQGILGYPLHIDSKKSNSKCEFTAKNAKSCSTGGEDNFGMYRCPNAAHRCSTTQNSTTQTWLGG